MEVWSTTLQSSTHPVLTPGKCFVYSRAIQFQTIDILYKFMVFANVEVIMSPLEKIVIEFTLCCLVTIVSMQTTKKMRDGSILVCLLCYCSALFNYIFFSF